MKKSYKCQSNQLTVMIEISGEVEPKNLEYLLAETLDALEINLIVEVKEPDDDR